MRLGITTDCVCDLPDEYMRLHDIGIVYFYITTAEGGFKDGFEITSGNIIEYLENGGKKAETSAPEPEEYRDFFKKQLEKYDELIHITISSHVSRSFENATASLLMLGADDKRVHIIDSQHLSTGMGHMIIKAVDMRLEGRGAEEIAAELCAMRSRVSTSFITRNADYLYRNGRAGKRVKDICAAFMLHPVLTMKEGKMTLKAIKIGSYEKAVMRYIRSELKGRRNISSKRLFITHACCTVKTISEIKKEAMRLHSFEEVIVTRASATVSGNCGPGSVGVLFVYE